MFDSRISPPTGICISCSGNLHLLGPLSKVQIFESTKVLIPKSETSWRGRVLQSSNLVPEPNPTQTRLSFIWQLGPAPVQNSEMLDPNLATSPDGQQIHMSLLYNEWNGEGWESFKRGFRVRFLCISAARFILMPGCWEWSRKEHVFLRFIKTRYSQCESAFNLPNSDTGRNVFIQSRPRRFLSFMLSLTLGDTIICPYDYKPSPTVFLHLVVESKTLPLSSGTKTPEEVFGVKQRLMYDVVVIIFGFGSCKPHAPSWSHLSWESMLFTSWSCYSSSFLEETRYQSPEYAWFLFIHELFPGRYVKIKK